MEFSQYRDNIRVFLQPYITEIKKSGPDLLFKGLLYNSKLYILVEEAVLYVMDLSEKVGPSVSYSFNQDSISDPNIYVPLDMSVYYKFQEITYNAHIDNMVYHDPVLHEDPKFMALATAKASEGAGFYFINTSIASIFTTVYPGLPAVQKMDKIELKVWNIGDNKLLINYLIQKKKMGITYDIYYKIINVNAPIRWEVYYGI